MRAQKHVTILGRASLYSPLPTGEVWGVNFLPRTGEEWSRMTRQFQIHPHRWLNEKERDALARLRVPTYVIKPDHRYPHAIPFPRAVIHGGPFASSFDYMMALAIWEGFDSILVTGVDYQKGTLREQLCEHVALAYWIGKARGCGIRVEIGPGTLLRFPWRYGFDYVRERRWGQQQSLRALKTQELDDGQARRRRVKGIIGSGRRSRRGKGAS